MLLAGIVTLIFASLIHCWYAANEAAFPGDRAVGYFSFGQLALVISILLLMAAVIMIWIGSSILISIAAIAIYFLLLPLLVMPLMQRLYAPAPPKKVSDADWEKIAGLRDPPAASPNANTIWTQLFLMIEDATERREEFIDINAGELHLRVGGYPGPNHRMPVCCRVMKEEMHPGDIILQEPPKGAGASLTVRYMLPRKEAEHELGSEPPDQMRQDAEQFFKDRDSLGLMLADSAPKEADAQVRLASYYKYGFGTLPKDPAQAIRWYRKAAEQGHAEAQIQLVEYYFYGDEVAQDYSEAVFWAHRAAKQGNAYAQLWLGSLYEKGQGVQQDYVEAARWYREAANSGFPNAKWFLGELYKIGNGVQRDNVEAYFWQSLAVAEWTNTHVPVSNSYAVTCDAAGSLLTQAELDGVRGRVARWMADHSLEST